MKILGFEINKTSEIVNQQKKKRKRGKIGDSIEETQLVRIKQDVLKWRNALSYAEQAQQPNRTELIRIYKDVVLDAHLSSIIQTRKINVTSKEFKLTDSKDEKDEEAQEFFNKTWFFDFLNYSLDSIFWGTTVIEFGKIDEKNGFKEVNRIPYEYVQPELSLIRRNQNSFEGFNYLKPPFNKYAIEVGNPYDLGLLNNAVPLVIWKKNALGAWSIRSDLFGMPIRVGKTDTRDDESREQMIQMLSNMDVAAWAVFDLDDEIQLIESSGSSGYEIYQNLTELTNKELSKLILGQTGTTDEKSFVGAAEVHERVGNSYTENDINFIKSVINDKLIPRLIQIGVIKEGVKFDFDRSENLSLLQQFEVDKELLKYYDIDEELILKRYGTTVQKKQNEQQGAPSNYTVMNDVSSLYKDFFNKDENCCK